MRVFIPLGINTARTGVPGGMVEWLRRFVSKSYALKPKSDIKPKVYKP